MGSDIQLLELASGIKDSLINTGFLTVKSILETNTTDLSNKVGVDLYIAQIILHEARKAADTVTHTTPVGQISHSSVRINTHHITAAVAADTDKLAENQM